MHLWQKGQSDLQWPVIVMMLATSYYYKSALFVNVNSRKEVHFIELLAGVYKTL